MPEPKLGAWPYKVNLSAVVYREVAAFVFVFEEANRIVVETPEYGHATYIFEMEAPMPAALQVARTHCL